MTLKIPQLPNTNSSENTATSNVILDQLCINVTNRAKGGLLEPFIGREEEKKDIQTILSKKSRKNVLLVAGPGEGKTATVFALAQDIVDGKCFEELKDASLYYLDPQQIMSGTMYRGSLEEKLGLIFNSLEAGKNILFIDEAHLLLEANTQDNSVAANIKGYLTSSNIRIICATTNEEYKKHFFKDEAFKRRFQLYKMSPLTKQQIFKIIRNRADNYRTRTNSNNTNYLFEISDKNLEYIINLCNNEVVDSFMPDRAIDFIDYLITDTYINLSEDDQIKKLQKEIDEFNEKIKEICQKEDEEELKTIPVLKADIRIRTTKIKNALAAQSSLTKTITIEKSHIEHSMNKMYRVDVSKLRGVEIFSNISTSLKQNVIGQDSAIDKVVNRIKLRKHIKLENHKTNGLFIFLGPSGVGKTELAKQLAVEIFGDPNAYFRVDMSEYKDGHKVSSLLGTSAGYVGYNDIPKIESFLTDKPKSVILFDEIEKAHKDVLDIFLQIGDYGTLTVSGNRTISFRQSIVVLTSNIGSKSFVDSLGRRKKISLNKEESDFSREEVFREELKEYLRPELIGRVDEIVVFDSLVEDSVKKISKLHLDRYLSKIKEDHSISLTYSEDLLELIAKEGFSQIYGARDIQRYIEASVIGSMISHLINNPNCNAFRAYVDNKEVKFQNEQEN